MSGISPYVRLPPRCVSYPYSRRIPDNSRSPSAPLRCDFLPIVADFCGNLRVFGCFLCPVAGHVFPLFVGVLGIPSALVCPPRFYCCWCHSHCVFHFLSDNRIVPLGHCGCRSRGMFCSMCVSCVPRPFVCPGCFVCPVYYYSTRYRKYIGHCRHKGHIFTFLTKMGIVIEKSGQTLI